MKFLLAITLLCWCAYTSALNVTQCTGAARKFDGLQQSIIIGNCKKPPCRLRKGTFVDVQMKLKPDKEIKSIKNKVFAYILGIPFPFIGVDDTEACGTIFQKDGKTPAGCPLKAGTDYVYKSKIEVLSIYPRIKMVVHWGLTAPDGDIICFEVPARITN